jgi:hypothetical protein
MLTIAPKDEVDDVPESEMPRFGLTASDGTFAVRHLPAGGYRYLVYGRFLSESLPALLKRMITDAEPDQLAEGEFVIVEGQETRQEIEALPDVPMEPATLSGVVRISGARVSKGSVQLSGRRWNHEELDERGEFSFTDLRPGRYHVEIEGGDESQHHRVFSEDITLGSGEVRQLDIDARLTEQVVRVTLADGAPAPHAMVHVVPRRTPDANGSTTHFGGGGNFVRGTDEKGEATLQLLPGAYSLSASSEELGRGKSPCSVGSTPGAAVTIVMESGIPCSGRAVLEGADLAGAGNDEEQQWHLYLSPVRSDGSEDDEIVGFDRWMQLKPPEFAFDVKNAAAGRYRAMLWGPRISMNEIEFELPPRGATDLVLRFKARD